MAAGRGGWEADAGAFFCDGREQADANVYITINHIVYNIYVSIHTYIPCPRRNGGLLGVVSIRSCGRISRFFVYAKNNGEGLAIRREIPTSQDVTYVGSYPHLYLEHGTAVLWTVCQDNHIKAHSRGRMLPLRDSSCEHYPVP